MQEKNIPNSKDPKSKKLSNSRLIKFAAWAALMAGVFSTDLAYNQQSRTPDNLKKKNTIELVEKNDSVEHEKFIHMKLDSIFAEYGQEKWMEVIKKHLLMEINIQRKMYNDKLQASPDSLANKRILPAALTGDSLLDVAAQNHAEDMYEKNYFAHINKQWKDRQYRIKQTWYLLEKKWENINYWPSTIRGAMDFWMKSRWHRYNILDSDYVNLWMGYCGWYRVTTFGGNFSK